MLVYCVYIYIKCAMRNTAHFTHRSFFPFWDNHRKNLMDISITALCYYAVGFAFAYGDSNSKFIGNANYFLIDSDDYVLWFFQFVFAGTTATIVSGSVAERCRFRAYIWYTIVLTSFVYPVTSHWIWSPQGFLFGKVLDFAGSGAVHLLGGAAVRCCPVLWRSYRC